MILTGPVIAAAQSKGIVSASRIVNPGIKRTMVLASTSQHSLSLAARETAKIVRTVAQEYSGAGAFDAPKGGAVGAALRSLERWSSAAAAAAAGSPAIPFSAFLNAS